MTYKGIHISEIIELAWQDEISFDHIKKTTGISEPEVIKLMRSHMKKSSFKMWRERVTGRLTKHSIRMISKRKIEYINPV